MNFGELETQYGLPKGLLGAVRKVESSGGKYLVSDAGALGEFQFMPKTAKAYGIDPLDPVQAANGAARMFADLGKSYGGNWNAAIAAYNGGTRAGKAFAAGGMAPSPETRNYIPKVRAAMGGNNEGPTMDLQGAAKLLGLNDEQPRAAGVAGSSGMSVQDAAKLLGLSEEPAAVTTGKAVNSIPRQLGLTARYALEGPAQAAQIFTEPVAGLMRGAGIKTKSLGEMATGLANLIGLPTPQGANERVIGDATRLVAGAGGFAGAAGKIGGMASSALQFAGRNAAPVVQSVAPKIAQGLAANPMQQIASAAGAGLAGGSSREAGGDGWQQAGAALLGGVAGGLTPGAINGVANAGRRMFTPAMTPQQMDIQLTAIMGKAGADYSQLPGQVQRQLRNELASSLKAGKEMDPAALARLADFRAVGATPTRGMVSQNPVQITREMNLAKTAANSADDSLHGMPMIQNQNNSTLIRNLNDAGAATGDTFKAGQGISARIMATNQGLTNTRDAAYAAAREMPGAKDPIYPDAVRNIFNALDEKGIVGDLPTTTSNYLNAFVSGARKGPLGEMVPGPSFNVQAYENLQKQLSNASMSPDSATRYAAGVARRALEETKIQPTTQAGGGQAQALLDQLNAGRAAHKDLMRYGESSPVIKAIVNGAEPDKIFQKFVIGGSVSDAQAVAQNAPNAGVKEAILAHLKDKSLNGASDEIGKFSQSGFNKALGQIGDRKLELFFNPEELAHLKSVGRVASYAQNQPVGSAVNNSNSGALLLGRGMDLLNKTPFLGPMVGPALKNINVSLQQRQANNILPGLLAEQPKKPMLDGLMLPGLAFSGGLLSP